MSSSKPVIFVIGGPGSGKGTQCDKIVAKYGFTHLSTGDLLREEVALGTERGKRLNEIMKSGKLVSLEEVLGLLKDAIARKSAESKGFLIDGYPREVEQAIRFEQDVAACTFLIYFECSDEEMTRRLLGRGKSSGRADDNEETIKKRLITFHENTQPILDHYKSSGKVKAFSAMRGTDEIFADVCKAIDEQCKL